MSRIEFSDALALFKSLLVIQLHVFTVFSLTESNVSKRLKLAFLICLELNAFDLSDGILGANLGIIVWMHGAEGLLEFFGHFSGQ